jgi:hypothetical protein
MRRSGGNRGLQASMLWGIRAIATRIERAQEKLNARQIHSRHVKNLSLTFPALIHTVDAIRRGEG